MRELTLTTLPSRCTKGVVGRDRIGTAELVGIAARLLVGEPDFHTRIKVWERLAEPGDSPREYTDVGMRERDRAVALALRSADVSYGACSVVQLARGVMAETERLGDSIRRRIEDENERLRARVAELEQIIAWREVAE